MATTVAIPFRGYLPYLSGKIAKGFSTESDELIPELRVASTQIIELTTLASLAIIAGIPLIRFILPDSYELSLQLLPVLVLAKWIDSSSALANTVFQFSDRFKLFLVISAVMVLTLIGLNLFAIPRYGLFGAAYATLGTLSLFSLIKLLLLRKILGKSILTAQSVLVLAFGITAVILFLNVKTFLGYALIALSFFATIYFFTKKWRSK
jgi:O-antigen/teichoic acid export membrane protein